MLEQILASDVLRMALLLGLFIVVVVGSFGALAFINRRSSVRSGLQEIRASAPAYETQSVLRGTDKRAAWNSIVEAVERTGLHLGDTKDHRLREKLIAAGFPSPAAPRAYTLIRLVLVFVLPVLYLAIALTREEPPGFLALYLFGSILGLAGLMLPSLFIQARADRRREQIVNGFPDALDLMLVCMEAGLGVEAALDRVARETAASHPLVAALLGTAVLQLRAGASREEAFKRMADAAGVDEIRSFTTLLVQSDKLGTSVSSTLRVYAEEMREKRRMRAEEKAHRLPVLISIPLVVFMLPTMIGVIMLPAAIRMVRDVFPLMTGG
ncbi:type II secretion system F family protein [Aurantiacibacter luteus]|uniref:Secretion system protein n=1 Tax=Aurantiacibacter luteus TaxID=1581420 RepID=A0A0G9MKH4_9SPHN|nr:type II secretion system F family protein [Aurantiacibacter luteus]KLE31231.1 secretion system protein [Aurantiacibacter luteus]